MTNNGREDSMTGARQPEEINVLWAQAFNVGDVDAMLELYEPDAMLVPGPDEAPVSGLAAIEASLRWLVGLRGKITFAPRYWLRHGDLALGGIDFHLFDGTDPEGNPVDLRGGTAEVARRQPDGTWKYVFDHPFAVPRA
jgi:ketosteroid isomerase-like protein